MDRSRGTALAESVRTLITGFPDVRFDIVSVAATGDDSAAAQWRMRGTNTGPMPGGPPTGGSIDLPGADFITYDPTAGPRELGRSDTSTPPPCSASSACRPTSARPTSNR